MLSSGLKSGYLFLLFVCLFVGTGCNDDDLKNATAVSSKKITLTKDRSLGFDVIYSDSAKVKAKGYAPVYDQVKPSIGATYSEMPKGVTITFFDDFLKPTGNIKSDYAINKTTERITIFRKNVIVTTDQITFNTEELTWDENTRMYYSPYGVVTAKDGSIVRGKFSAPQDFSTYKIEEATAETTVKGDLKP